VGGRNVLTGCACSAEGQVALGSGPCGVIATVLQVQGC
jgi:hypothetical protein